MQLFFFLLIAVFLCFLLISLLSPPAQVEEEFEVWEPTELRLESLLQGTLDTRAHIRESSRNQILAMGAGVIPRLINALSQELCFSQPNEVWCEQVESLLQDFGLQTIPALLSWLQEEGDNPAVVESIHRILVAYDTPALRLLLEGLEPSLLKPLVSVFRHWGRATARLALKEFKREPGKKLWQNLLLELDEFVALELVTAAKTWEGEAQHQAFFLLSRLATVEATPIFLKSLQHKDIHKRLASVRALERINDSSVWESLLPLLKDSAEEVRALAIQAIAGLGKEESVHALRLFWEEVRNLPERLHEALLTSLMLAQMGAPASVEMIERGLQSGSLARQRLALQLLSFLPAEERQEYLLPLLEHPAESIVSESIRLLLELNSTSVLERIMQRATGLPRGHRHYRMIEQSMLRLGSWALSYLIQIVHDPKRDLQTHSLALKALLFSGDQRALEPVLNLLQKVEDPELEWGVEPQELYLFLRRLSHSYNIEPNLKTFLDRHPESSMAPALQLFLEQRQSELS